MPRSKLAKSGLMALREMLTRKAPRKQELVPEDLFRGAAEGNEHAVARIAEQQGQEVPADQDKLAELLNRVRPDRRSFLRGLGQAGASAFGPSPLTILRDTMKDIGILEMNPREMMNHSKKYLDVQSPWGYGSEGNVQYGGAEGLEPRVGDLIKDFRRNSLDFASDSDDSGRILKMMELDGTPSNIASLKGLSNMTADLLNKGQGYQDEIADDMAAGMYENADKVVARHIGDEKRKYDWELSPEAKEEANDYLKVLHQGEKQDPLGEIKAIEGDTYDNTFAGDYEMNELMGDVGNVYNEFFENLMDQHGGKPNDVTNFYRFFRTSDYWPDSFDKFIERETGKLKPEFKDMPEDEFVKKIAVDMDLASYMDHQRFERFGIENEDDLYR